MELQKAIAVINKYVPDPSRGLPDEVFKLISRITPLVNVDLLIKDEKGRTLLSWRNDAYCGSGWHVPGGIIRLKETSDTRIKQVAKSEIGADIEYCREPIAINQIIYPRLTFRSHFISLLYKCFLGGSFIPKNKGLKIRDKGYLKWHKKCPDNIIKAHEIYRKYIEEEVNNEKV